jgi:hypothetical protein
VSEAAIGSHFRLDENCVPVAGAPRVRVYFAQLRRALEGLERGVERETPITNAERRAVSDWVGRLRRTLDLLALRHFFPRAGAEPRIDRTDSGFPHWSALLELGADLERRDAELAGLPDPAALKRSMLERIVRHALHPTELQAQLMRRIYLEAIAPAGLVRPFQPGPLEKVGSDGDEASWFWSFATYDRALNRPFLHGVYFAWEGRALAEGSDEFAELCAVAERSAVGRATLLVLSKRLDELLPRLHPRIVKRLVLGPFWAPGFTGQEGPLGALLGRLEERWPFALRFESEVLISERETRVGAGWLTKGELRQVFWLPDAVDLAARGVSQLARHLVLPHWLAQHVADAGLLPDHRTIVLDESAARDVA